MDAENKYMNNILKLLIPMLFVTVLLMVAPLAVADDVFTDEQIIEGSQTTIRLLGNKDRKYREYYRTWHVVEVTEESILLERTKKNGEVVTANIERSRRPSLEAGARVRYDKKRNRLGKTLDN